MTEGQASERDFSIIIVEVTEAILSVINYSDIPFAIEPSLL